MAVNDYRIDNGPQVIVSKRAPTTRDHNYEIGTEWIHETLNDVYFLTSVKAGLATWTGAGGGTGDFSALNVNPGNATVTAGDLIVTGGTITNGTMGAGVVQSSSSGVLGSSCGDDGELLIGNTSTGIPAWAAITCPDGSIVVTKGGNSIALQATGGTSSSFATTSGGPVSPLAGVLDILGYDSNITTDGATANTVKIRLSDSVTTVGALTAGANLNMSSGSMTVTSSSNAVKSIYLHANAGTSETIDIHAEQGNGVESVKIHSDAGGLTLTSGLATADAINITATNAAGGIDVDAGTAGINIAALNGPVSLISGTGAMNIGADAAQHTLTLGSNSAASSSVLQAGTGALTINGGGVLDIDGAGIVSINSSGAAVNIANDAVSQDVNIGIAGARTITVGNSTGATSVVVATGTGNLDLGVNSSVHNTRIGSTAGSSALTAQTGTGTLTLNSGGILAAISAGATTIDSVGALELNSSAGAIAIGNDAVAQNINIATGSAARIVTIGNGTGATQVVVDCGSAGLSLGATANAHAVTVGSTNSTSSLALQSGSGALTLVGSGVLTADAAGVLELNSSGGAISIGNDADAYAVNIATGSAARTVTIGNATGATSVVVNGGTGAMQFGSNAIAHAVTVGSVTGAAATTIQAGTSGLALNAAGMVSVEPGTTSSATTAATLSKRVGVVTFTGETTAAGVSVSLVITNTLVTAGSAIFVSASNLGANDAQMTVTRVLPAAGSFTVTLKNNGAAALNGDIILTFWCIA